MALPTIGTLAYNGVTFDVLTKSEVSGTPVLDDAQRVTAYVRYTITVTARLTAGGGAVDGQFELWRKALQTVGGTLTYSGKGFGSTFVVGVGNIKDVAFGPIPTLLSFTPIGNLCALVEWTVTTCVAECVGATAPFGSALLAFNFSAEYNIDDQGLTTRSISGYAEIPMNYIGADSADLRREKFVPPLLPGFRRQSQRFVTRPDKRRCDFSIIDTELPVPLLPGTTHITADHSVKGGLDRGFAVIDCNFSVSITMPISSVGKGRADVYDKFMLIVGPRLTGAKKAALPAVGLLAAVAGTTAMTKSLMVREEIFTRTTHFNFDYSIIGTTISNFLKTSGIWSPVAGADADAWTASLKTLLGPRGTAGLKLLASDDAVTISLCTSGTPPVLAGKPKKQPIPTVKIGNAPIPADKVPPDASWLYYSNEVRILEDDKIVAHKPLQGVPGIQMQAQGPSANNAQQPPAGQAAGIQFNVPDKLQRVGAPTIRVEMFGRGVRFGNRVPVPRLVTFGGQPVTQIYQNSGERSIAGAGDAKVWTTSWSIIYRVTLPPNAPQAPANPIFDRGQ